MGVKTNTIANLTGQVYAIAVSVIVLPMFLQLLGPDAFGLVGFFSLMHAWLRLLELGTGPAVGREMARLKPAGNGAEIGSVYLTFERFLVALSAILIAVVIYAHEQFVLGWFDTPSLDFDTMTQAMLLMGLATVLRFQSNLYKSVMNGFEAQVWRNGFDAVMSTLRFPVSALVLVVISADVVLFFWLQLGFSVLEFLVIRAKSWSLVPILNREFARFDIGAIRPSLPFAMGCAYTGAVGVLLAQLDKIYLSGVLALEHVGYLSLVTTLVGGLSMLADPVNRAVLPRMVALLAKDQLSEMLKLYFQSTRLLVCVLTPIVTMLCLWPAEFVYVWSGSERAAEWIAPILPLFVMSATMMVVAGAQFLLQSAYGDISLNVWSSTVLLIVTVPLIILSADWYGILGVAWVVFASRSALFLAWVPFVHSRLIPGIHGRWLISEVLFSALVPVCALLLAHHIAEQFSWIDSEARGALLWKLATLTCLAYAVTAASFLYRRGRL